MTHEESKEKLTPLEQRFVNEYPLDWVGSAAYMRASKLTNKKSAGVQACKLLKKDKIKNAIAEFIQDTLGPPQKRLKENVEFWEMIRNSEKATMASRMKASEYLAKFDSQFVERKEVAVEGQVVIVDNI